MAHFDCWASRFGETVTALELAPEGTGYRARTRFSKFFNLPELMNLFKEIADIKTADQLHLPTPEVEYHNIVAQPTEHQKEMVKGHACYLFLTKTTKERSRQQSNWNTLCRGFLVPKEIRDKDCLLYTSRCV